jgi:hypothetical protein
MGKISLYSTLTNPLGDDVLIGTDVHDSSITKNFSIQSLFDIGLEISTSKIHLYDSTIENYGEITLDNDVFRVKGAPLNTRNLLVSSAAGYLSFKKNNFNAVFNASSISDNQTWTLPDYSGTIALVETNDLQQVTNAGSVTTNVISVPSLNIKDNTLGGYGQIILNNDTLIIKGSVPDTHNLFISSDTGFISFKNGNDTIKLDATATTDDRTYIMPNESGTLALVETTTMQQVTTAGNTTNNGIILSGGTGNPLSGVKIMGTDNVFKIGGLDYTASISLGSLSSARSYTLPNANGTIALQSTASGSFVSYDGKTVTVANGIITSIV